MAKSGRGLPADGPTLATGAEATPATLPFTPPPEPEPPANAATATYHRELPQPAEPVRYTPPPSPGPGEVAASLQQEGIDRARAAAAQADAKKKKKPEGSRASELSIMQQIARRMKRLASDAARDRVYGWYTEEFRPKGGEPS